MAWLFLTEVQYSNGVGNVAARNQNKDGLTLSELSLASMNFPKLTFGIVELDTSKLNHRRVASSWQHPSRSSQ